MSPEPRSPTQIALEVLSVAIGSIAEDVGDFAASPPTPPTTYAALAATLERAGADISVLAGAMTILARQPSA